MLGIASHRIEQLFGLTAGFLTFARLIVPLRIALALALTPAADKYIVKGLLNKSSEAVDVDMAEVRVPRRGLSVDISPRFKMLRQESISAYTRLLGDLNYSATLCTFDGCLHPFCSARVRFVAYTADWHRTHVLLYSSQCITTETIEKLPVHSRAIERPGCAGTSAFAWSPFRLMPLLLLPRFRVCPPVLSTWWTGPSVAASLACCCCGISEGDVSGGRSDLTDRIREAEVRVRSQSLREELDS